jgi:hypothetical protein
MARVKPYLVGSLVHARDAVVPAQAVVVEQHPEDTHAQRTDGDDLCKDAAAHGRAAGILIGKGAQADTRVAHAWRRIREAEKKALVQKIEHGHRTGASTAAAAPLRSTGAVASRPAPAK